MHAMPYEFVGSVAQHFRSGGIYERHQTVVIEAADSLVYRGQDQARTLFRCRNRFRL